MSVAGERWDEVMDYSRVTRFLKSVSGRHPSAVANDFLNVIRHSPLEHMDAEIACKWVLFRYQRWQKRGVEDAAGYIAAFLDNWAEALNAAEYYIAWDQYADKETVKRIRAETRFDVGPQVTA